MKKIYSAFTLIELIVGITISMTLMVSVGIFISGGMKNVFLQQKVLENTDKFTDFAGNLHTSFNLMQSGSIIELTASGIIFKRGQNYGEGGFSYIGEIESPIIDGDGIYCLSGSEDVNTNHIIIKNFIPFEENGEDIFSNYNLILTGSTSGYTSYQKEHVIKLGNDIVVGKGIFGDKFEEGAYGTGIYLNSPTGLAKSGSILFISDTLNNRILYYDTSSKYIYKLLDEADGLNEPTGLYYDDSSLYIANSGNGEILKYSSKKTITTNPNLNLSFSGTDINNINKFSVEFLTGILNIALPITNGTYNTGSFDFGGTISQSGDYSTGSTNKLEYYFADYTSSNSVPDTYCTINFNYYTLESNSPVHKTMTDCNSNNTGTLVTYSGSTTTDFISSTEYKINISDISSLLTATGSYYVNLKLFNGTTEKYSEYFPYFTQSDDDLTTADDNILEIFTGGLNYPTGIWGIGNDDFNEFGKLGRDFNKTLNYHLTDTLLDVPIKSLTISNTANDLISLVLKYYKSYNCYNLDDKIERTFLLNKNLK